MSKPITRREAITALAAAPFVVAAASSTGESAGQPLDPGASEAGERNAKQLYDDVLSKFSFKGQNGQDVNIPALKTSLQNKFTTLSFGYAECQEYCPMINTALAAVGEANPKLTSIIVAANPKDGETQEKRDAFMARLRDDGIKHDVVILFPQGASAAKVAIASGSIAKEDAPLDHNVNVKLYAPGGQEIGSKSGLKSAKDFVKDWSPLMKTKEKGD